MQFIIWEIDNKVVAQFVAIWSFCVYKGCLSLLAGQGEDTIMKKLIASGLVLFGALPLLCLIWLALFTVMARHNSPRNEVKKSSIKLKYSGPVKRRSNRKENHEEYLRQLNGSSFFGGSFSTLGFASYLRTTPSKSQNVPTYRGGLGSRSSSYKLLVNENNSTIFAN